MALQIIFIENEICFEIDEVKDGFSLRYVRKIGQPTRTHHSMQNKTTKLGFEGTIKMVASEIHSHPKYGKVGRMLLELGEETLID